MRPDCLHTIFLNYILPCPSIIVDIIERTFQKKGSLYIACNDRNAFFTSDAVRNYRRLHRLAFTGDKWVAFADPVQQTGWFIDLKIAYPYVVA